MVTVRYTNILIGPCPLILKKRQCPLYIVKGIVNVFYTTDSSLGVFHLHRLLIDLPIVFVAQFPLHNELANTLRAFLPCLNCRRVHTVAFWTQQDHGLDRVPGGFVLHTTELGLVFVREQWMGMGEIGTVKQSVSGHGWIELVLQAYPSRCQKEGVRIPT